ncbi:MAG TPA: YIP1 family protein [Paracoccus sp.]|nr:YIP1 family protein [Paracoccus sp. (in: a-proteobacteria)]
MAVSADILRSYRAPRAVLRERLAMDRREARALVYLTLACGLFYIAQWPRLALEAQLSDAVPFEGLMVAALFGWLFLAPLFFYAVGALLGLVLRLIRGGTDPFAARLALFWALLAVSPLALVQGAAVAVAGHGALSLLMGLVVLGGFLAILIAGLAEALEAGRARA